MRIVLRSGFAQCDFCVAEIAEAERLAAPPSDSDGDWFGDAYLDWVDAGYDPPEPWWHSPANGDEEVEEAEAGAGQEDYEGDVQWAATPLDFC